jgi:translation initiation factor IF-2
MYADISDMNFERVIHCISFFSVPIIVAINKIDKQEADIVGKQFCFY